MYKNKADLLFKHFSSLFLTTEIARYWMLALEGVLLKLHSSRIYYYLWQHIQGKEQY